MASLTSKRTHLGVALPSIINTAIAETAKAEQRSVSVVVRRAIDWHRGLLEGRSADSKQYTHPEFTKPPSKLTRTSFAIDPDATEYLGELGFLYGMPKSSIISLILLRYYDLLDLKPRSRTGASL